MFVELNEKKKDQIDGIAAAPGFVFSFLLLVLFFLLIFITHFLHIILSFQAVGIFVRHLK